MNLCTIFGYIFVFGKGKFKYRYEGFIKITTIYCDYK